MQLRVENSPGGDKHVMILTSSDTEKEPVLSFESADDLRNWQMGLAQAIVDSQAWKIACDSPMKFEAAETKKNHFNKPFNFYDQVSADHSGVYKLKRRGAIRLNFYLFVAFTYYSLHRHNPVRLSFIYSD